MGIIIHLTMNLIKLLKFSAVFEKLAIRQKKPNNLPSLEEIISLQESSLAQLAYWEGLEVSKPEEIAEMYAYDCGYQGKLVPDWILEYGLVKKLDLMKEYKHGLDDSSGKSYK